MKTVVIEGKDLLFTLFKLAFYIWIEMWNVRILLVAVKNLFGGNFSFSLWDLFCLQRVKKDSC